MANKPQQQQMNIELPEDIAEGTYVNMAIIGHSNSEFVLDFVRSIPNMPKARVKSRIVVSPAHAKRLLKALNDNVQKYESQFGVIEDDATPFPNMNFSTPQAQA